MTEAAAVTLPGGPERIVPPTGITAWLTILVAGAMAVLATFALALLFTTGRIADRWGEDLAQTATVRIPPPVEAEDGGTARALEILGQTPGVARARALDDAETAALLAPWLGPDLPLDALAVPRLIEIDLRPGFEAEGLRLRLEAEVPGAILDDHARWREPLIEAAGRLRLYGWVAVALIGGALAGMVTLAANAALAANAQVIAVLRLLGARDAFVARAFTRRFALRALGGAAAGTAAGVVAILLLPDGAVPGAALAGPGFRGAEWAAPGAIPAAAALIAYAATRLAAHLRLRETA